MESPQTSKSKIQEGDISATRINCTPKNQKTVVIFGDEFSLYHLHKESSPNFRAGQDVLEVGWGDSPEPLNVEQKFQLNKSPVTCKKKLETKESPKSSIPLKRRNVRSTCSLPSKSTIDVAKYVAEVQELSKNIMREFNAKKIDQDLFGNEKLVDSTQIIDKGINSPKLSPVQKSLEENSVESKDSGCYIQNKDSNFDSVLNTFINEEDEWLSQALTSQELTKTPLKGNFIKSKSENELSFSQSIDFENKNVIQNCRIMNNNFRRTSSFDMTKPHNNSTYLNSFIKNNNETKTFNKINGIGNQYSLQEIERKRLEAKYRKERREIERKKLEALKKLEMKKLRAIKT